ncbi:MAG: carbohydrate kinase family protein [bacterium]|nr:carbohydrate kinase family protein [Candidatus Sumerlaeota bacterium]
MTERRGIAAGGNWIIDHVKLIEELPPEEQLTTIISESRGTGGAPYNVLVNLATLDPALPLEAIGIVGNDDDGQHIIDHLASLNIDARQVRKTSDAPTSHTDVMTVQSTGRRTFFHNPGANALFGPASINLNTLKCSILHLGYLLLLKSLDEPDPEFNGRPRWIGVLGRARAAGMLTSLDMVTLLGPRIRNIVKPVLPYADYFVLNELEASGLTSIPARDNSGRLIRDNLRRMAASMLDMGVQRLVVIHAPEAALWLSAAGSDCYMPSLDVPKQWIKGTAGAGDAFCAGILYGLHQGWAPQRCLELAAANAAMSLSDPTCTGGLKSLGETMKLIGKFGLRPDV